MKVFKLISPYILIIFLVIIIRTFIITPVRVDGSSMDPTLKNGDYLFLKKYDKNFEYGDIVVLNYMKERLVKRVIGLPGDKIVYKNGHLYVNGETKKDKFSVITADFSLSELGFVEIPEGFYLVLGDNRGDSKDSRIIGLIRKKDIEGKTNFRLFPFNKFGEIEK